MIDFSAVTELAIRAHDELPLRSDNVSPAMPATWIPGRDDALFALSSNGDFFLLIRLNEKVAVSEQRLNALRIESGLRYELSEPDGGVEAEFATVVLQAGNDDLVTAFGTLCAILLAGLPVHPSAREMASFLQDFLELFAPRRQLARETIVGLWGELWVMSTSRHLDALAGGWHLNANEKFDFSLENFRLEVKTTETTDRVHRFALGQLDEADKATWIGSLCVLADSGGQSVTDLLSEVVRMASAEARILLTRKSLQVLAGDLEAAADFRYSASGDAPMAIFRAGLVPRPEIPVSAGISDVHFRVGLAHLVPGSLPTVDQLFT